MINNKDNIDNNNTIRNVFIGLFSVLLIVALCVFACLLILSGLKVKINILIIKHTCKALVSQTLLKNGYKIIRNKNQN